MHAIQILKAYVYIYICVCVCTWICISLVRGESWWPPEIRWWMHPSWCAPSLRLLRPSWPSANPIGSKSWVSRPSLGYQWIGLRENLPETMNFPMNVGFPVIFPLNQSIEFILDDFVDISIVRLVESVSPLSLSNKHQEKLVKCAVYIHAGGIRGRDWASARLFFEGSSGSQIVGYRVIYIFILYLFLFIYIYLFI